MEKDFILQNKQKKIQHPTPPPPPQSLCPVRDHTWGRGLLLGVGDLHGAGRRDPEALQGVFGHARLRVALKLHEGDVVFPRDQADLFETGEPAGDEQSRVRREQTARAWTRQRCGLTG